jgi:ferritin-like metal-binding protein YciE
VLKFAATCRRRERCGGRAALPRRGPKTSRSGFPCRNGGTRPLFVSRRLSLGNTPWKRTLIGGGEAPRCQLARKGSDMSVQTLEDLFVETLKDIYYAEQKIVEALPKMAKAVQSKELKKAFEDHLEETKGQVERLEKVFANRGEKAEGKECEAIEGLIEEGEEAIENTKDPEVLTAALLAAAQAVEHYEIARYGTLCAWAEELDDGDSLKLLKQTLAEEKNADKLLTKIADSKVNRKAA